MTIIDALRIETKIFDRTTGTISRRLIGAVKSDLAKSASEQRLEGKMTLLPATPFNASVERSPKADCFVSVPQELSARIQPEIKFAVQKATADADLREIHSIGLEAFAQTDPVPSSFSEYKESIGDLTSYVVKNGENKVVGYYQTEPIKDASLYVYSIGIPKNLKGTKSSFHTLMAIKDDITQLAEQSRVKTVTLHVDSENKALVRMYKKFGFKIKETEANYYENGNSAYLMEAKVSKAEEHIPIIKTPQASKIKNKNDLKYHLERLKDKNGNARLDSDNIEIIVSSADTPEKAQFKFDLTEKLAQITDKNGNARLDSDNIERIVSSADTPEKAQFKFKLTRKLAQITDKNGNARLTSNDLRRIVSSADTPEKAQFKAEYAYNKEFISKFDTLDTAIGNRLYAEILKSGMSVDVERMNKLYNYLSENKINLQQHGEERITNQSIVDLFDSSMLKAVNLLDDGTIKYATKLKYNRFKEFIIKSANLNHRLRANDYYNLQENLPKLPTPKMKLNRLQSIIALKGTSLFSYRVSESKAINLINSPRTTIAQINLASEIFTSSKPYQEQIQEFFERFNVAEDKKEILQKFFAEQKLILAPKTQNSVEKQLMILDKKIQDVRGNAKIPESKKSAYIEQLEKQKAELTAKPQSATTKLSDKALTLLAQQIEHHINIPNNNLEFNRLFNSQIYKQLNIKSTPKLVGKLCFDEQYLSDLFSALSDSDFAKQFTKLIQLIKENPTKPLSELREALEHNQQTKKLFEQNGINYQKWIKFDKNSHLPFSCETNLQEAIRSVELNIVNELNGDLFKSVDKNQTDKILQALSNAGYKLDAESITKNGQEITQKDLEKIVDIFKNTINQNAEFWDKPLADSNMERLKNELIDHLLKGRKKEVADLSTMANVKMDLSVRLSNDDEISRNLFLGNHVGCCTSVGGGNSFAAPQHLMNTFIKAIEIVDKKGNSYGNSMCYFAKVDGKVSFVIDSFEVNGKLSGNQVVTDAIVDYAKQVTAEMGKPDIPIIFGPNYNKINMSKLKKTSNHTVEVIGRVEDDTYIDLTKNKVNEAHSGLNLYEFDYYHKNSMHRKAGVFRKF